MGFIFAIVPFDSLSVYLVSCSIGFYQICCPPAVDEIPLDDQLCLQEASGRIFTRRYREQLWELHASGSDAQRTRKSYKTLYERNSLPSDLLV